MSRLLPTHHLSRHPSIQELGLANSFPTKYEVDSKMVSSGTMYSVAQDYLQIIRTVLDYASDCNTKKSQFECQLSKVTSEHQLLVSKFQQLANTGNMEFRVNGTVVLAHSEIVSCWSVPLAIMLQSPMREGSTKCIEIKDEDPEIVQTMVKYFYTASVDLNSNNALPLLRLCALYDIVSLRDKCCEYLLDRIDMDNFLDLFIISWLHEQEQTFQWTELLEENTNFISQNADLIIETCSEDLCNIGLLELSKIWPLLKAKNSKNINHLFLGWAARHWNVSDFNECLVYLYNEDDNTKSRSYAEAARYFYDFCLSSIGEDFDNLHTQESFLQLSSEHLAVILERDDLHVKDEQSVLDSVLFWIKADPSREKHLPNLLQLVRFPYISAADLIKIPHSCPLIGNCEGFGKLLEEALHFQLKASTTNNRSFSSLRLKKRRNYKEPQIDADNFISYVSSVLLGPRNPSKPVEEETENFDTEKAWEEGCEY